MAERTLKRSFAVEHVSVVTEDAVIDDASVYIEDGIVRDICAEPRNYCGRKIDGRGKYLLPGFIDLHSDAIEKELEPRPNTLFPVDFALFELDKKLASCGITTIYHSLSFAEMEVGLRSNGMAADIIKKVHEYKGMLNVNTRIHARYEITDSAAVPILEEIIKDNMVHLLSLMDHTPGQGQFREIRAFKGYYGRMVRPRASPVLSASVRITGSFSPPTTTIRRRRYNGFHNWVYVYRSFQLTWKLSVPPKTVEFSSVSVRRTYSGAIPSSAI
jgi:alpha-D-ribose 1-methylphosphonate 5-triphosphate diphosphatase